MAYFASRRRPKSQSVHDFQHELLAERLAIYKTMPLGLRGSGMRLAKQECAKHLIWFIKGHISGEHHIRGAHVPDKISGTGTVEEWVELHDSLHSDGDGARG